MTLVDAIDDATPVKRHFHGPTAAQAERIDVARRGDVECPQRTPAVEDSAKPGSAPPTQPMRRRLAAILSADVQGYSRLMGDNEEATVRTLTTYREVAASTVAAHRGTVVDAPGDNILAEFPSAVDAVECAVDIQRVLASRNAALPAHRRMEFRIGINLGDVIADGERIYGAASTSPRACRSWRTPAVSPSRARPTTRSQAS
jgi:class 3 adenylate cyclase